MDTSSDGSAAVPGRVQPGRGGGRGPDRARPAPPASAGPGQPPAGSPYRQPVLWRIHAASALLALAAAAVTRSPVAVVILLVGGVVAVSTNGLAATAIAEYAGSAWAGRALGIQNTGQNALAAATPPVLALAIGSIGFGGSFALVALFRWPPRSWCQWRRRRQVPLVQGPWLGPDT